MSCSSPSPAIVHVGKYVIDATLVNDLITRELSARSVAADRQLKSPPQKKRAKLFDHFIVAGLSHSNEWWPNYVDHDQSTNVKPEVLVQFPKNEPISITGVADFCFPDGLHPALIREFYT